MTDINTPRRQSTRTAAFVVWRSPGGTLGVLPREQFERTRGGEFFSSHRTRAAAEKRKAALQ